MLPIIAICLWISLFIVSVMGLFLGNWAFVIILIGIWIICSYLLFRNTLNTVQVAGRLYWITRDYIPDGTPLLTKGFMRETDSPFRAGKGIQVRIPKRTVQVGICDRGRPADEIDGLVYAMQGRLLEDSPHKIGNWDNGALQEEPDFDTV